MTIINLTPHEINVVGGAAFPPSGTVARVATVTESYGSRDGVPLTTQRFGEVTGLPDQEPGGPLYVVSAMVRMAVPHRGDVASPGELVRDASGAVIGCASLVVNDLCVSETIEGETRPSPSRRHATVDGEAVRVRYAIKRLRTIIPSLELALCEAETLRVPPGAEGSQALVSTAYEVVVGLAKVDVLLHSTEKGVP